jgi:alkyl sulfatase BDS1-like metallo-beta-lactamase superfamily hydrolase
MQHAKASDVLIAQHHWPVWGNDNIQDFIKVFDQVPLEA